VEKALAKAPADRFRTATEFVDACQKSSPASETARSQRRWLYPAAIVALVVVAAFALTQFFRRSNNTTSAPSQKIAPTIAVLPFRNIGSDSTNEALSDGISEEIAAAIGKIPGLGVRAPRSSFSLKGTKLTIPQIGSALGVNYLVDGTLQQDAGRLRVRVALLEAGNDSTLWTTEYDRPQGDVFAIQDEIARVIASALRVQLAPSGANVARRATESAPAHELYLRGRYFFQRRDSTSLRKAREYFELAIARDSNYALAYTGLSDAISHASVFGYVPPRSTMPLARRYVDRALALDSTLAEAHSSRAFIATFYEWDWNIAGAEYEKALSLDPNYPSAHLWRAWYFLATDSLDNSIREARLALDLEPFLVLTNTRLISLLYYAGRFNEALEQSQKTFELDSTFFQLAAERARVMVELKQCERALVTISPVPDQTPAMLQGTRGYIYARCGRPDKAVAELKHLLGESKAGKNVSHYSLAVIQAGLGNKDAAFAELNAAYNERAWTMFLLKTDPPFAGLRGDPRFVKLVRMVRSFGS
jgi:TolB-like protein/predicted negative regulator of RcsB-dependent stress response